jgi:dolichol-phosphate mannosyltransferase
LDTIISSFERKRRVGQAVLTLLVPVYNEGSIIKRTLTAIRHSVRTSHEILCIYDFPEDTTVPAVMQYKSEHPEHRVELVYNDYGRGVLNALKKGFDAVNSDTALVVMADLSDDLSKVDEMFVKIRQGFDIVCGSRYMRGGRHVGGPSFKRALSRLAGVSLHILAGIPTHDVSNSFKMYRTEVLRSIVLQSKGGFELGLEILAKAWIDGRVITEVPTTWRERPSGQSKFKLLPWLPKYLRWYLFALKKNRLMSLSHRS